MKVVFTHAYFLNADPKEQAINKPYPPLGLLYLSAWLEQNGYDNDIFDSTFSSFESQQQFLLDKQPDVIAIYTNLMTKLGVVDLVKFIRSQPSLAQSLVVIGGPDVTYNIENYLGLGADAIVIGEGEQTMLELVQACDNGLRPQFGHIPGLAYRDADGHIIRTVKRSHLRAVDELPMPNRHKIDLHKYLDIWKTHHGRSSISVSTQRGCPYTCRWCSTAVYGQSYRRRSPAMVAEELAFLKAEYNPDQLWFVDDVFTVSHKWLAGLRDELQKRNVRIPFECITRAERMNEEVIQMLDDCGCFRVWIGAESGSQRILDAMDRRVDAEQVQKMIVATRAKGIETGTFIMLGYPGETEEDIHLTLEHLRKSNPDLFTITIAYPIKGTGLYEEVEEKRLQELDWTKSTDRDFDFERSYPRPYYDYAVRWVVNGLLLHKARLNPESSLVQRLKLELKMRAARAGMWWYRNFGKKRKAIGISKPISDSATSLLPDA
ncbi:MAG: radical SAM protein [Bacteroidota bacterium]